MREMNFLDIQSTSVEEAKKIIACEEKNDKFKWFIYHPSVEICALLLKTHPKFLNHFIWTKENVNSDERTSMLPPKYFYYGENALGDACSNGNVEKVKFLINHGADINSPCKFISIPQSERKFVFENISRLKANQKVYPLFATFNGYKGTPKARVDIIKLLLENGLDLNCKGEIGMKEKTISQAIKFVGAKDIYNK